MAFAFLSHVVADLTLGKPALFWLPQTASVRDALRALKLVREDVSEISIWDCAGGEVTDLEADTHSFHGDYELSGSLHSHECCRCVGKVCMQTILCYLASDRSLRNLAEALLAPVTALLPEDNYPARTIQHVDPQSSLLEALQLIAEGAHNLVVPIAGQASKFNQWSKGGKKQNSALPVQRSHNGQEYCWLTHEDVLRFLLGSITVFSPLPMMSIDELGIINTNVRVVGVDREAVSALEMIKAACHEMSAVAVVDNDDETSQLLSLVGDISCTTLQRCNETAALALATLSVGDFLMYAQDCRNSSSANAALLDTICTRLNEKLVGKIKADHQCMTLSKSKEANLYLQYLEIWEESSSDGEESGADSPTGPHDFSYKWLSMHQHFNNRMGGYSKSRSGPISCNPKSSLVAVLLQALAHREHYVWVTGKDNTLLGIVTFSDILNAMLDHANI